MTDLISRADAIEACCRGWNNTAEDCIRNIKALPSAEAVDAEKLKSMKFVTIKGDKVEEAYRTGWNGAIDCVIGEYASAEAENPKVVGINDADRTKVGGIYQTTAPSADAVQEAVPTVVRVTMSDGSQYYLEHERDEIQAVAVQGEWDSNQSCSICGCQPWYEHDIHTLHYCPNCGARMKGGDTE